MRTLIGSLTETLNVRVCLWLICSESYIQKQFHKTCNISKHPKRHNLIKKHVCLSIFKLYSITFLFIAIK